MPRINKISNEEFNIAYSDVDNIRIIEKASRTYKRNIPLDELHRCKLIALWECLKRYKKDTKAKFSTFLYQRVDWECKRYLASLNKFNYKHCQLLDVFTKNVDNIEIDDILSKIDSSLQEVIIQRFFHNMTLTEIGITNNYSRETARRNIIRGIEELKALCSPN